MDTRIIVRIIAMTFTFGYATSRPTLQRPVQSSSLSPVLLRHLLRNIQSGTRPRAAVIHPEYGTLPPEMIKHFDRYDWQYYEYDHSSRRVDYKRQHRHQKRQSGSTPSLRAKKFGKIICARNRAGVCVAKCGFGAPLDSLSHNRIFGCRKTVGKSK